MTNLLLEGIVGSTAYGLATEDSDIDKLGVFAVDTEELHGLNDIKESINTTKPDKTLHEIRKYIKLALKCNPTVMELMWLPEELYTEVHPLGAHLLHLREDFLSARLVRNAYFGYAEQQFVRLSERGDGSFSSTLRNRTAKHARHLARLLHQGFNAYSTGRLEVRLSPERAETIRSFGRIVGEGDLASAKSLLHSYETKFTFTKPAIPAEPTVEPVEDLLHTIRREFYI